MSQHLLPIFLFSCLRKISPELIFFCLRKISPGLTVFQSACLPMWITPAAWLDEWCRSVPGIRTCEPGLLKWSTLNLTTTPWAGPLLPLLNTICLPSKTGSSRVQGPFLLAAYSCLAHCLAHCRHPINICSTR